MIKTTIVIANLIKDLFVLSGMSYLYFWKGVSGWWWVLAILLMAGSYGKSSEEKEVAQEKEKE